MRLKKSTEAAIRTLMHLAKHEGKSNNNLMAKSLKVPRNHLHKIVQELSRGGYLKTSPGKGGGVTLVKPAGRITLYEVVNLMEGPIYLTDCILDHKMCYLSKGCTLRPKIEEVQEQMLNIFKSSTIQDLINGENRKEASK